MKCQRPIPYPKPPGRDLRQNARKEGAMRSRRDSLMFVALVAAGLLAAAGVAAQGQTYKPGDGVTSPVLIKEVKPNYTEGAMRRRVEGVVEMSVVVLRDGTVGEDVRVTKSLDEELDQQAIIAVKQWRFRPGTKDGEPVNVRVNIEMTFTLKKR